MCFFLQILNKILSTVIVCILILQSFLVYPLKQSEAASIYVDAESAILIDASSGRILYEKNAYQERPMASVTKITTAILALEEGNLESIVKVSKRAAETGEASIWLEEGEEHSLEDLLFALMIKSANDSAVAIAEHVGGSVEEFAKMMTKRAKELGANNTNYKNPNGLHDPNHYTTAHDLAIITRHALLNLPKFRELITTGKRTMAWEGHEWDRILINKNKLLSQYDGADGVKTGFTSQAGRTFVGSATRDGRQLIAVVLHSPDIYADSSRLLDYGFNSFETMPIVTKSEFQKSIPVSNSSKSVRVGISRDLVMSLAKGEQSKVELIEDIPSVVEGPIKKGDKVGQMVLQFNNKQLATVPVYALEQVEVKSLRQSLWQRITGFFSNIFRFTV